jgi:hypothetical protein
VNKVIGKITLTGTREQNQELTPFCREANVALGQCIKPVTVVIKPRADMPLYAPGKHAMGYWKVGPHHIWLADDCFDPAKPDLPAKTLGHELVHTLQDDWFTSYHRKALLPYLRPEPDNWRDPNIGGKYVGYEALPYECIAVWGSAALFNWDRPAYSTLYKRKIAAADWPEVKTIMVAKG